MLKFAKAWLRADRMGFLSQADIERVPYSVFWNLLLSTLVTMLM